MHQRLAESQRNRKLLMLRSRVFDFLEPGVASSGAGRAVDSFLAMLILLNVLAVILETVEQIASPMARVFAAFEQASVTIFTIEYVLRVWSAPADPRFANSTWGRFRFMLTPMAILDLVAILPFYLPMLSIDLRMLRTVRLVRVFRILKLTRYSRSLQSLAAVLREKREDLIVVFCIILILLVLVSSLMYYVEHDAQPTVFSSIPATMWWALVTLTTVGYGDVYPLTQMGKLLGGIAALLGIGIVALPAGLLASGLMEQLQRRRISPICPHCGKAITH